MTKQGNLFLVTVLIAVSLAVGMVFWVGLPLLRLAFFEPERDQPLTVVNLVSAPGVENFDAAYQAPLRALLASEQGELVGDYRLRHLMDGARRDEWDVLNLLHIPVGSDMVQAMTSAEYRALRDIAPTLRMRMLGTFAVPGADWRDGLVLWLMNERQSAGQAFAAIAELAGSAGARIVLDTSIMALGEDMPFQRLVLMDFESPAAALNWLRTRQMVTERAVLNANLNDLAVAIYASGSEAGAAG